METSQSILKWGMTRAVDWRRKDIIGRSSAKLWLEFDKLKEQEPTLIVDITLHYIALQNVEGEVQIIMLSIKHVHTSVKKYY